MPPLDPDPLVDWLEFLEPIHRHFCDQFESTLLALKHAADKATSTLIDQLREEAVGLILAASTTGQETVPNLTAQLAALIQQVGDEQQKQVDQYGLNREKLAIARQTTTPTAFRNARGQRSLKSEDWPRRLVWSVVHVDLVAYQPLANLYRQTAPERVALLGQHLRDEFESACRDLAETVTGPTCPTPARCRYRDEDMGDGCIYVFASAEHACLFAERVHRRAIAYNQREYPKPDQLRYRWWFRIGIETGEARFIFGGGRNGGNSAEGEALIGAARIGPQATPGAILINPATHNALPESELKRQFSSTREVPDKHNLPPRLVHEWVVDPDALAEFQRSGRGAPAKGRRKSGRGRS